MVVSLRHTFEGTHTHWASPFWGFETSTLRNNTMTHVRVLNLSGGEATVTVRFNDSQGVETHAITRVLKPRHVDMFLPEQKGGGWVEVVSNQPVAPSGFVTTDERSPHIQTAQTVAVPMSFFPIVD